MTVKFSMTKRLAELAGFEDGTLTLSDGQTLRDALSELRDRFRAAGADDLVQGDDLHPSILVVVNGTARATHDLESSVSAGDDILLMLPVAGG